MLTFRPPFLQSYIYLQQGPPLLMFQRPTSTSGALALAPGSHALFRSSHHMLGTQHHLSCFSKVHTHSPGPASDTSPFFLSLHPGHTPGLGCSVHLSSVFQAAVHLHPQQSSSPEWRCLAYHYFCLMLPFSLLSSQIHLSGNRGGRDPRSHLATLLPPVLHLVFCPF